MQRKKFLATIFLNEIDEINFFVAELKNKGIDGIKSIKYDDEVNSRKRSFNLEQYANIVVILGSNPYFTPMNDDPIKRSFDIFNDEIYSFQDPELIRDLIQLGRMIRVAEGFVLKFYQNSNNSEENRDTKIILFISMTEHIKNKINKILSDGTLKKFASSI